MTDAIVRQCAMSALFDACSQCRKADKTGVVAQGNSEFGFARRLSRWAADAGDLEECARLALVTDIGGQRQYRFQQANVADGELRRVDANRHAACAGVTIVAGQRALTSLVELARGVQGKRVRRDDEP